MRSASLRRLVIFLCGAAAVVAVAASCWLAPDVVRTEDRNGDGRPDVWRAYNGNGQLTTVAIDTNFDGRSDVHEYYEGGNLVRRESDRDFDDRIDLVEEFDPATHDHVRSIVDLDYDGTADVLVLFQGGQPVFSTGTRRAAAAVTASSEAAASRVLDGSRQENDPLSALTDPFRADASIRSVRVLHAFEGCAGLTTSGGLPKACSGSVTPIAPSSPLAAARFRFASLAPVLPRSPRGPPLAPA